MHPGILLGENVVIIKEVDLGILGVTFPEGGVGMVIAQPYLKLDKHPPFACAASDKERLLECIDATLDVARRRHHGALKTHFTVFPECTVPGADGIAKIDAAMAANDWPSGTVVLAGIEGMTPAEFRALVETPNTHFDGEANSFDRLQPDHWVNCSVTWVKLPSNEVYRWIQPKISPAWVEKNVEYNSMYRGSSIFVFKGRFENGGRPYRFHSLLCFDWIGYVGDKRVWEWVLASTNETANKVDALLPLTWVFVMQCNDEPCHSSFMGQVQPFFNQTNFPSVERKGTCLVMANVAGKERPGRALNYGRSAVIHASNQFSKSRCAATYSNGGEPYRPGNLLENFSDSLFRESGACIHSFIQADPVHAPHGAAGRSMALLEATVHPFPGIDDPRANGGPIPAVIKWLHDNLDDDRSLAKKHWTYKLADASAAPGMATIIALRTLKPHAVDHSVRVACVATKATADKWDSIESSAVDHMHQTLSLMQLAGHECEIHGHLAHATSLGDRPFDIIAVSGPTHAESEKHIQDANLRSRLPLVIVSRDEDNTFWGRENKTIMDVPGPTDEVNITDPLSATRRIGYQTFLYAFQNADSVEQLKKDLNDIIY